MIYRFLWFSKGGFFRTKLKLATTGSSSPIIVQSAENVITFTSMPGRSGEASYSTRSSPSRLSSSIDVGMPLEASWCGADGSDSGGGRSAPDADCPALLARLSAIPAGCCTSAVLFSIFVADCFSSTAFGLHLFCGGETDKAVSSTDQVNASESNPSNEDLQPSTQYDAHDEYYTK